MFFEELNISMSPSPIQIDAEDDRFLLDATPIDLFDAWLFAAADASLSLSAWNSAATDEKSWAYTAYLAALDREEQAALVLATRVRRCTSGSS
jgi:hypothetical protein